MSRSGSIGNVVLVDGRLAGRAVANHAIRIVPSTPEFSSLVYLVLSGPIGRSILPNLSYGSVIDQIKSYQLEAISIPIPRPNVLAELHKKVIAAVAAREHATEGLFRAQEAVLQLNSLPLLGRASWQLPDGFWSLDISTIKASTIIGSDEESECRLDAHFHNTIATEAIANIQKCPTQKRTVRELTDRVFFCNRFTRTFVEAEHGIPYLAGKNIVQVRPRIEHFLSLTQTKEMEDYKLSKEWILLTCSGTLGRTCFVWRNFETFVATHDLIRVVANKTEVDPGYLYAYLSSPYGYHQILRFSHGSVVDHVTPEQVAKVIVALPSESLQKEVGDVVRGAYEKRAEALRLEDEAQRILVDEITGHKGKET